MRYKRKIIFLVLLIVILTIMEFVLPNHPHAVVIYDKYIFLPYQSLRNLIFGHIPISVGDILYLVGGLCIIIQLLRWIYYVIKFKTHKHYLATSFLHTVITVEILYILFIIGWGANYYKPNISTYWKLNEEQVNNDSDIIWFDRYLIGKLNYYAPHYHSLTFKEVDKRSIQYYKDYTDSKTKLRGLGAKASIFGYLMQNLGIQGYYNPFTGEAQVNRFLPPFMLPFVICHEMAHQSGIAAEDDANLLSYAIGTTVNDSTFNYSSYFNIWLYAQGKVRHISPKFAKSLEHELNALTLSQIDTLREIRRKYQGKLSDYSGELYDEYLRMHQQKEGILSYGKVALSALVFEQRRLLQKHFVISIP